MIITSTNNLKIKDLIKLHDKKHRDETSMFLVEGEHLVAAAIAKEALILMIELDNVNYKFSGEKIKVTTNVMKKISKQVSIPKVIGVCRKPESNKITGNVLILDSIQDPGNLGTIIRNAVSFKIQTIILSPQCVDVYNDKVIRSTEGLIFSVNILSKELAPTIELLKKDNYLIIGSVVKNGDNLEKINSKYALIIGNEGSGIKTELINLCDKLITIKINSLVESLNAGVASGIMLYELNKE